MKIVFSDLATADLNDIALWIARDDVDAAFRVVAELEQRCFALVSFPQSFPVVDGFRKRGIRKRTHGSYLIFYKISARRIDVLRILHQARDYGRLLRKD